MRRSCRDICRPGRRHPPPFDEGSRVRVLALCAAAFSAAFLSFADAARAGGVNLTWSPATPLACYSEQVRYVEPFACDQNEGRHVAVASFLLDADVPDFEGLELVVDVWSVDSPLPNWWQFFNAGSCRRPALTASADFGAATQTQCVPIPGAPPQGGVTAYLTPTTYPPLSGNPNQARLKAGFLAPQPLTLVHGVEYYGAAFVIDNQKTVGSGACSGCTMPVVLILNSVRLASQTMSVTLQDPVQEGAIFWQRTFPTAAPNLTWGAIKSLYH